MGITVAVAMIVFVLGCSCGALVERRANNRQPFKTIDHKPDREPLR